MSIYKHTHSIVFQLRVYKYSGVRVIASRILHEICLLIGELAIWRTNLTLIVSLGAKSDLLLEQLLIGEHYCTSTVKVTYYEPLGDQKSVHNRETS